MTTALLTDRYELTMLEAALRAGLAERPAVFEVFARRLPAGRRFGVVAGQGRLSELVPEVCFDERALAALDFLGDEVRAWLLDRPLGLQISGYREGEAYAPGSPVLTVAGCFGEGLLLETLVLSVLNHDTAVASAAARIVLAADGRPLLEMGSRRTHEQAAVAAARAANVAAFALTTNLEAGRRHGVPTAGTSAHSFTLAHRSELDAFRSQVAVLGPGTTLLVDSYDTAQGVRNAIAVAGTELGAVRLDSGDPREEVPRVRALLDELGARRTRIVVTGDLDETSIAGLAGVPADVYGVGTSVVTGSGAPTAGFVYKLVAVAESDDPRAPLLPVAKRSTGKSTVGGRKWAYRTDDGREVLRSAPAGPGRPLQEPLPLVDEVDRARAQCAATLAALSENARRLDPGPPAWTAEKEDA
jgi:nicotinate phosphoribosyltransferase